MTSSYRRGEGRSWGGLAAVAVGPVEGEAARELPRPGKVGSPVGGGWWKGGAQGRLYNFKGLWATKKIMARSINF
jgi:hypothetical protein